LGILSVRLLKPAVVSICPLQNPVSAVTAKEAIFTISTDLQCRPFSQNGEVGSTIFKVPTTFYFGIMGPTKPERMDGRHHSRMTPEGGLYSKL